VEKFKKKGEKDSMRPKYAIITGFLGKLSDRFAEYQPARSLEEKFELAKKVPKCAGLEVIYPSDFKDPVLLKKLLKDYNFQVSSVNLNVKAEEKWRFGSFSSSDKKTREEAIKYMKTAMDFAHELGCNLVTCALLNDGNDYPFEINYINAWNYAVESIRECADYRKDVKISIEYKLCEPRMHVIIGNAGEAAYFCEKVGRDNVGVTLDVGHAFQALEVPSKSLSILGSTGRLFYVHINDNYRNWDWDMLPGTVNLWDYLEFVLYLKKIGYNTWITADVFPQRLDPVKVFTKTFEWMDFLYDLADELEKRNIFELIEKGDVLETLSLVKSVIKS
jgi:xylose isomerase